MADRRSLGSGMKEELSQISGFGSEGDWIVSGTGYRAGAENTSMAGGTTLVDLPGYGFAKASKKAQAALKAMIEDYVSHSEELAMLFILLDSRHGLMEIDRNFITAVSEAGIPFAVILTKCDKLSKTALEQNTASLRTALDSIRPDIAVLPTSSDKRIGKDTVLDMIDEDLKQHINTK